jgi:hypothetical protein
MEFFGASIGSVNWRSRTDRSAKPNLPSFSTFRASSSQVFSTSHQYFSRRPPHHAQKAQRTLPLLRVRETSPNGNFTQASGNTTVWLEGAFIQVSMP